MKKSEIPKEVVSFQHLLWRKRNCHKYFLDSLVVAANSPRSRPDIHNICLICRHRVAHGIR